jgi:DNA-binding PadR family transcriptional regulator
MRHIHEHFHHPGRQHACGNRSRHDERRGPGRHLDGHGFGGHRGGPRARRGDVRLAILLLLAEAPANGYSLIGQIAARTDDRWRPSPGSIYPVLQHLTEEGLAEREGGDQGTLSITEAGRAHLAEHQDQADRVWDNGREVNASQEQLRESLHKLMGASREIAVSGSEEQRAKATEMIDNLRRTLYGILAE